MRKRGKWLVCGAILLALLAGWFAVSGNAGVELPEELPASAERRIRREIQQAAECYRELYLAAEKLAPEYSGGAQRIAQADIDAFEEQLAAADFPTLDSDAVYPTYLANPEGLRNFWEGKTDAQTVFRISGDGGLQHLYFCREDGEAYFVLTDVFWDEQEKPYVRQCEAHPIYDMELTDWGIFYYQVYPEDPHYITYDQIRLASADRELYDLTRKYILPVGYLFTNLFLTDWQEGEWGELSFNDLFEYLYRMNTGEVPDSGQFVYRQEPTRAVIPAALFEETILPWFAVSLEDFRRLSGYEAEEDCYLWRPRLGDDVTTWKYPMCEPEVTEWRQNGDGTVTLTVKVCSPDLKTDRLFTHEVTVRPLEDGKFQYAGNKVTYVSDRGLPPSMARFELDDA